MLSRVTSFLVLVVAATAVNASPIQWTLTDVLFEDGGTATGSLIYDADTDSYSAISITTTDNLLAPLATYTSFVVGGAADAALVPAPLPDLTGQPLLQLIFQFSLTNAGGTVFVYDPFFPAGSSFDGSCLNAACSSIDYGRIMVDGAVIGTAVAVVPLPGAVLLLVSALGALAGARRARS